MGDNIRVFSGRTISPEDIETIKWTVRTYTKLSRRELAATICESIGWVTLAGKPKIIQCCELLELLEGEGLLHLPAKMPSHRKKTIATGGSKATSTSLDYPAEITECGDISLNIAGDAKARLRWREQVNKYHTLGYRQEFGCRIQYFIVSEGIELGCIQFSASAWALQRRDEWIGWTAEDRKARLNLIVNNSRYMLFPWVHVKNLSSRVLSLAAHQVKRDWLDAFCYEPVLLETFVDTTVYKGTCYKAANWIYLGDTQGRGRMDRYNKCDLTRKAIYVYPLRRDFRSILLGLKPYKVVMPDE